MHQIIDNDIGTDTCIHVYIDNALINHWYTYVFFNVFHLRCYNCILIIPRRRRDDNAIKDQLREAGGVWLMNHACHMDFYLVCKCPHIYSWYIYRYGNVYVSFRAWDVIWDWMMKMYYICWPSLFSVHFEARFDLLKLSWQWIPSGPVKDFTRDFDPLDW